MKRYIILFFAVFFLFGCSGFARESKFSGTFVAYKSERIAGYIDGSGVEQLCSVFGCPKDAESFEKIVNIPYVLKLKESKGEVQGSLTVESQNNFLFFSIKQSHIDNEGLITLNLISDTKSNISGKVMDVSLGLDSPAINMKLEEIPSNKVNSLIFRITTNAQIFLDTSRNVEKLVFQKEIDGNRREIEKSYIEEVSHKINGEIEGLFKTGEIDKVREKYNMYKNSGFIVKLPDGFIEKEKIAQARRDGLEKEFSKFFKYRNYKDSSAGMYGAKLWEQILYDVNSRYNYFLKSVEFHKRQVKQDFSNIKKPDDMLIQYGYGKERLAIDGAVKRYEQFLNYAHNLILYEIKFTTNHVKYEPKRDYVSGYLEWINKTEESVFELANVLMKDTKGKSHEQVVLNFSTGALPDIYGVESYNNLMQAVKIVHDIDNSLDGLVVIFNGQLENHKGYLE